VTPSSRILGSGSCGRRDSEGAPSPLRGTVVPPPPPHPPPSISRGGSLQGAGYVCVVVPYEECAALAHAGECRSPLVACADLPSLTPSYPPHPSSSSSSTLRRRVHARREAGGNIGRPRKNSVSRDGGGAAAAASPAAARRRSTTSETAPADAEADADASTFDVNASQQLAAKVYVPSAANRISAKRQTEARCSFFHRILPLTNAN
jgi:hypothetical protein